MYEIKLILKIIKELTLKKVFGDLRIGTRTTYFQIFLLS